MSWRRFGKILISHGDTSVLDPATRHAVRFGLGVVLAMWTGAAVAQSANPQDVEERIRLLERRILELEASQKGAKPTGAPTVRPSNGHSSPQPARAAPLVTGSTTPKGPQVAASEQQAPTGGIAIPTPGSPAALPPQQPPPGQGGTPALMDQAMVEQVVAAAIAQAKAEAKMEAKAEIVATKAVPDPAKDPSLQAAFLYSDTVPTLKEKSWEVALGIAYGRANSGGFSDRSATTTAALRYGFTKNWEASVRVPYVLSERRVVGASTDAGAFVAGASLFQEFRSVNEYFGDSSVNINHTLLQPKDWYPGVAVSVGSTVPTGPKPYKFAASYVLGQDPRDPFVALQSRGHWSITAQATLFRVFDPIVMFLAAGIDYPIEETVSGRRVAPGQRYIVSGGVGISFSEFTTLGMRVNWSYEDPWRIDGVQLFGDASEGAQLEFKMTHRLDTDLYLEPSVSYGLTDTTQDFGAGVNVRKRF